MGRAISTPGALRFFQRDEMIYGAHILPRIGLHNLWVVEGYADVWSLYELGVPAIAVMNDRPSDHQINWITLAAGTTGARIVLAFDGDKEGQIGERQCYSQLLTEDVRVSRLALRGGEDVSAIIERGGSELVEFLHYLEARS